MSTEVQSIYTWRFGLALSLIVLAHVTAVSSLSSCHTGRQWEQEQAAKCHLVRKENVPPTLFKVRASWAWLDLVFMPPVLIRKCRSGFDSSPVPMLPMYTARCFFLFLAGEGEKVRDLFSPYKQRGPSSSNYCGSASCRCEVTRRFPIGCYEQIKTQKRSVIRVERKPELSTITEPWQHLVLQLPD